MNIAAPRIALIIPARNEELSLPGVLKNIPTMITKVVVVDNGSTDGTARIAAAYGAEIVYEAMAGYGRACLAGLSALRDEPPEIVAFVDADGSDELACLPVLVAPVVSGEKDFVLGVRIPVERGALSFQQQFGHLLATGLIRLFWKHRYRDLGPMRVIGWRALERLNMADQDFGWTVEMQVRALKHDLRILEIRVPYHRLVQLGIKGDTVCSEFSEYSHSKDNSTDSVYRSDYWLRRRSSRRSLHSVAPPILP